jgi:hypothetical protein
MKFLCIVAHPDDCVIFFNSLIEKFSNECIGICYLTYSNNSPRFLEMMEYWNVYGIPVYTLGFNDKASDFNSGECSFNVDDVRSKVSDFIVGKNFDYIASHNFYGEYGHPHHIFLGNIVRSLGVKMLYPEFNSYNGFRCLTKKPNYTKLPIHRNAVNHFFDKFYNSTFATYGLHGFNSKDIFEITHKNEDLRLPDRAWLANTYLPSLSGDVLFIGVNWLTLNYNLFTKANLYTLDIDPNLGYLGSLIGHHIEDFTKHTGSYNHVSIHGLLGHPSYNLYNFIDNIAVMESHLELVYEKLNNLIIPGGTLMIGHHLHVPLFDKNFYLNSLSKSKALRGYKVVATPQGMWTNFIQLLYKYK